MSEVFRSYLIDTYTLKNTPYKGPNRRIPRGFPFPDTNLTSLTSTTLPMLGSTVRNVLGRSRLHGRFICAHRTMVIKPLRLEML